MSHLTSTEIELRSFVRASSAFNHEAMSLVPNLLQEQNNNMEYLLFNFFLRSFRLDFHVSIPISILRQNMFKFDFDSPVPNVNYIFVKQPAHRHYMDCILFFS